MNEADLRDLQLFAAVAAQRSFRKAAVQLRLSVYSLSQRLRDLEERLGVRLLNRTTRSVSPTEAGEELLTRITPALREMSEAVQHLSERQRSPSGRLRINAPAPAAELVLAPMIAPFLKAYPGVELEIVVDPLLIDIVAAGYDAGVRYEESLALDMVAVSLGPPERYMAVASPGFVAQHGLPQHPRDLLRMPTIATRFPNGVSLPWEFEKDGETVRLSPKAQFASNYPHLMVPAAIAGQGVLISFEGYVRAAIDAGLLVPCLEDWLPPFTGPLLYYPSRRQTPPALAAFVQFVREWRREHG